MKVSALIHQSVSLVQKHCFGTPLNMLVTLGMLLIIYQLLPPMLNWLMLDSVINEPASTCRSASGACWSFIQEKWRLVLFGRYPFDEQWRPFVAIILFVTLLVYSLQRANWTLWLAGFWLCALITIAILLLGGVGELTYVETALWGGLPLTLLLSVVGMLCAYPMGVFLALGRQSSLPMIKMLCVTYIELIRGVPLITLLFMATLVLPLFLPAGVQLNNLACAQIAIILFTAAYLAEVVRGGLQAIPKGQYEAAAALGLKQWQVLKLIILPQALRIAIPATVGTFISMFKDTSLVLIVGLMDLMSSTKTATIDLEWQGFSTEAYLFTAFIYFICCFSMSRYSQRLERN